MSSDHSSNTMGGNAANNTTNTRTQPEIRTLDDDERPPSTHDKLNLQFKEVSGRHSLDIYIRRDRPIGKALEHFAKHLGGQIQHYRFIFEGERLDKDKTPNELELNHDDTIEVFEEAVGGGETAFITSY